MYRSSNKRTNLGEQTIRTYTIRVLGWLRALGLVAQIGRTLVLQEVTRSSIQSLEDEATKRSRNSDFFLGEAPPAKVVKAFSTLREKSLTRVAIEEAFGRNTCYVLIKLGLIRPDGTLTTNALNAEHEIAIRAYNTPAVRAASELLLAEGSVSGLDFGRYIAKKFGTSWSEGSQRRYGTALRQWAEWSDVKRFEAP